MFNLFHKTKIANIVVKSIPVYMMDNFSWCKESLDRFFHDKSMFKYISFSVTKRMIWGKDSPIPIIRPISNLPLKSRMSYATDVHRTPFISTSYTAKPIFSSFVMMLKKGYTTYRTNQGFFSTLFTPSVCKVTFRRTKSGFSFWVFLHKVLPAFYTNILSTWSTNCLMPGIGGKKRPAFSARFFFVHGVPPFSLIYNNILDISRTIYKYCAIAQRRVDAELAQLRLPL